MQYTYTIHTDGGSRGNPGPAALGVVLEGPDVGKKSYAEYIGERTNNEAEYEAVIFALQKLKSAIGASRAAESTLEVYIDSELVVRQLNGAYKLKDEKIKEFFVTLWNLRLDYGKVIFIHVPREKNTEADSLVNQALDREASKLEI